MLDELRVTLPRTIGVATYPPGATFGPRRLRDYEFVWIIDGEVEYGCDGATFAAPPGAIVLCRAGTTDFFRFDPAQRTRHAYFHFNLLSWPRDWSAPEAWPYVRLTAEGDLLRALFGHLLTWAGKGDPLQRELTVLQLLAAFVSGEIATGAVPPDPLPPAVERAQSYIHERLDAAPDAPIALGDLALAAGVNREHLCRLFAAATGHSPMATVRLARLDRAAVLLARSNYRIGEVASMCGFASPFHFSRRFKDAFGHSPRDLRRRVAAGETPPTSRLLRSRRAGPPGG